jgi:hypothetical protein
MTAKKSKDIYIVEVKVNKTKERFIKKKEWDKLEIPVWFKLSGEFVKKGPQLVSMTKADLKRPFWEKVLSEKRKRVEGTEKKSKKRKKDQIVDIFSGGGVIDVPKAREEYIAKRTELVVDKKYIETKVAQNGSLLKTLEELIPMTFTVNV